jgi:hypothetical protein
MIRTDEIRKGSGQLQFSLTVLESPQFRPKVTLGTGNPASLITRGGVNLTGSQVLVGFLSALCTTCLLLWAIIRLWLFD